jgi:ABC-type multidrug transport system ATPase subunit
LATTVHSSLQADLLGKRFNHEWIFRNLSYTFTHGNIYAITGPNGSGKSTLLQVLWGQVPASQGNVHYTIEGTTVPVEEVFKEVTMATPYMDLIDELTLDEMVDFHFALRKPGKNISRNEVIELLELGHARDKYIGNFSSGMKQRVKLGLALLTSASFVFLDEPFTNLDSKAIDWYKNLLPSVPHSIVFIASNDFREYENATAVINISDFKPSSKGY